MSDYVVKIDMKADIQKAISDAKTANEERKVVREYMKKHLRGIYTTSDGREVMISGTTAKKYTSKAPVIKLRAAPELVAMLKHSTFLGVVDAVHDSFSKFAYYETHFEINDEQYVAEINVGITRENESILYDLNQIR